MDTPEDVEVIGLSGTSGGAVCATLAWDGLVRGDAKRASDSLGAFWDSMSASDPWDALANQALANVVRLRDLSLLPEISPYHAPTWGEERFRDALNELLRFDELRLLARKDGAPSLKIGAVEVLSGRFEVFSGDELCVECLLASAAIPELFRAVTVPGRGIYWDGLFSQNPPVKDLVADHPDEIWVIQINAVGCAKVPTETHEILDRRNELAGNLSLTQELAFIEKVNKAIAKGELDDSKYTQIRVERIVLDLDLGYRTKLDRRPEFLNDLIQYGQAKWRAFSDERGLDVTSAARRRPPSAALSQH